MNGTAEFGIDRDILLDNIDHHIGVFKKKVFRDRRKTTNAEIFKGTAAAFTTALLGIGQLSMFEELNDYFQLTAIILTAFLAIVAAWDALFRHKNLWLLNISARNRFFELREDIQHTEATGTVSEELLIEMYSRYKEILRTTNEGWEKMRSPDG